MPDGTYAPKVYRKQGGDELVVASGGIVTVESGGLVAVAAAGGLALAPGEIGVADLSANLQIGHIPLNLGSWRLIASSDIPAIAVASGNGGQLALDTAPSLKRVNGATDKKLRIAWAAAGVVPITADFAYPADLDDAATIVFHMLAAMAGATDIPVMGVAFFEGVGDTNAGGNTAAVTGVTVTEYTRTIAAVDVGAYPNSASIELTPAAHGTDILYVYATWLTYQRKS
jgi:hypothetical protein